MNQYKNTGEYAFENGFYRIRMALAGTNMGVHRSKNEENDIILKFENGQIKSPKDVKSLKIIP